jgi:hypothetical protein
MRTNPFLDVWPFIIGSTEDQQGLGPWFMLLSRGACLEITTGAGW